MEVFIAQVINGLSLGSIYVLLVTGFNLLLLVAMIIHFAYPQVVIFSMYIAWTVLGLTGNNIFLAICAAVASSVVLNVISAPLFQKIMKNREEVDINTTMVMSLGIGMIITDVLSHGFNNGLTHCLPSGIGWELSHSSHWPDKPDGRTGGVPRRRCDRSDRYLHSSLQDPARPGLPCYSGKTPAAPGWWESPF